MEVDRIVVELQGSRKHRKREYIHVEPIVSLIFSKIYIY